MIGKTLCMILVSMLAAVASPAARLLIPMDAGQANHLKAYGIVYAAIANGETVEWLLNYKGGSFVLANAATAQALCRQRGVTCTPMANGEYEAAIRKIKSPSFNGDVVALTTVPRIAVYTPSSKKPWDDAVTLALTYAGIPFDKVYVTEVLDGALNKYDWLHLHHEDFTGQYGKFWIQYKDAAWYKADVRAAEQLAARERYKKVWQMQLAVVRRIRDFVAAGGNLFAMCSATDTYDIELAANGLDICDTPYDGDGMSPNAQARLNFANCFAFTGFSLTTARYEYEHATIDNTNFRQPMAQESTDYFSLLSFPAKFDPVPSMLCQNHTRRIKGFMGQTTAFRKEVLKPDVVILADKKDLHEARYIHGKYRAGTWTFYGGHDPEDYEHKVGEPPTDLDMHPQSPGYRLILNNVLCLASGKKDVPPVAFGEPSARSNAPATNKIVNIAAGATSNSLVISLSGAASVKQIERVELLNADSREVFARTYNAASVTLDMDHLPAGLYTIKVNGLFAGKVVKN